MRLIATIAIALFLAQAYFGSRPKAPNADAAVHYRYGETLLGRANGSFALPGDGAGPCLAAHAWCARRFASVDSPTGASGTGADDRVVTARTTIPSLWWARLPTVIAGVLLLLLLTWFTATYVNRMAAAAAVLAASLTPDLIGHARFIGTDVVGALGFFAGIFAIAYAVEQPRVGRLSVLAVVLAVAQLAKITNLALYPLAIAVLSVRAIQLTVSGNANPRRAVVAVLVAALVGAASLIALLHAAHAGIAPEIERALDSPPVRNLIKTHSPAAWSVEALFPRAYLYTIALGQAHNSMGHPSYLLGAWSHDGWPAYFLIALLVKIPIPISLLGAIGLWRAGCDRNRPLLLAVACAVAYLAYFTFGITVHIGLRHMLPIIPIGLVLAGTGAAWLVRGRSPPEDPDGAPGHRDENGPSTAGRITVAILFAWLGLQTALVFPHHASYFNEIAGGSNQGWRWLIDSNVDWEQDAWIARRWADAQSRPVTIDPVEPTRGLIVIRANRLVGVLPERAAETAWLREHHHPVARLSPALFVFDVP